MALVNVGYPFAPVGKPGEVHTTQKNPILAEAWFYDTVNDVFKKYVYLKGVASTILGSWVTYDEAGVTAGIDTDTATSIVGPVAIATAATVASTWGWYGRKGSFTAGAISGGGCADNAKLYATSTVFLVDDVAVTGSQIHGAICRAAESSAIITAQIDDPWIGVTDAII